MRNPKSAVEINQQILESVQKLQYIPGKRLYHLKSKSKLKLRPEPQVAQTIDYFNSSLPKCKTVVLVPWLASLATSLNLNGETIIYWLAVQLSYKYQPILIRVFFSQHPGTVKL